MRFSELHPFIRFSHFLTPTSWQRAVRAYDCRLFYVAEGEMQIFADKSLLTLRQNDALFLRAGVPYRFGQSEKHTALLAFNFDLRFQNADRKLPIPPSDESEFVENHIVEEVTVDDLPSLDRTLLLPNVKEYAPLLLSAHKETSDNLLYSSLAASGYLTAFLTLAVRRLPDKSGVHADAAVDRILSYLQEHYNEPLTNAELARIFHYHPNYIGSLIRRKTGQSLHKYLLQKRIAKALMLLETTTLSVTEIASTVGFCDISYFSNYFRRITGRTPKEYRAKT